MTPAEAIELTSKFVAMSDEHLIELWKLMDSDNAWVNLVAAELERRNIKV